MLVIILLILALVCFVLAAAKVSSPVDLAALGLAFVTIAVLAGHPLP